MKSRSFKRIMGALLIIASLVVSALPTGGAVADVTKSVASDFQITGDTLLKYTGTASAVSVPDSVKIIADEAFANNTSMTSITLPSSLKKISYAAFSGCSKLEKVVIPDLVEEIGTAAFCNCISLTSFTLGKNVKELGTGVFTGCSKLSSITGNEKFICVDGAIYDNKKTVLYELLQNAVKPINGSTSVTEPLREYVMPESVTYIKPYAFYGCKNITSVQLSGNLTEIPAYSFSYCNSLSSISIPYSTTLIDMKAFENCINLSEVNMPVTVAFIHKTAFDGCSKLKITAPENSYADKWFKDFDTSNVNIIEKEDSDENEDLSDLDVPYEPVETEGMIGETIIVGRQAVFFIDNKDFTVNKGNDSSNNGNDSNGENENDYEDYSAIISDMQSVLVTETNGKGLVLPKFAIVGDEIANRAYYNDETLLEYEIADDITSIGDFSFARTNLTSITIPESVTHIGYGAFYHCDRLSTIVVPATVTSIEPYAFDNTKMLENWKKYGEDDFLIMGDGILVAYKGMSSKVIIPDSVKHIGAEVFKDNEKITEVSLSDSVLSIEEEAFSGCINLENITGGMNVEYIGDRAFDNCPVNTIRIVDSVKEIGLKAFDVSKTTLSDDCKIAVFQGDELPKVTYSKTSSRLSNSEYREDALSGVKIAIVNSESVNRVGTVLDREYSGFSGLICVISEKNNEYFNGTLKIIDCTLTALEAMDFSVPSTVYIYGKGYNFLQGDVDGVIDTAKSEGYMTPKENASTVSFDGSADEYVLTILKNSSLNNDLIKAYKRIYGDTVPGNMTSYDISLREVDNEVLLTKFGKQKLNVCIKLPDNMPNGNLHVICMDEDGQLEDLPYEVKADDKTMIVSFDISHTGTYGLYSFDSRSNAIINLDDSPDTGDLIHPKWFLAIGLMAMGLVLLLLSKQKKIPV